MRFKDLNIGDRFCFASEKEWWSMGMAKGPWIKISPRKYILPDLIKNLRYTHQVGTINVEVFYAVHTER